MKSGMKSTKQILQKFDWDKDKYVSAEWQLYGYNLALELGDLAHKSMYIKFSKTMPRAILEEAKNFVKGAGSVRNRGRLFMWKLKELRGRKDLKASDTIKV